MQVVIFFFKALNTKSYHVQSFLSFASIFVLQLITLLENSFKICYMILVFIDFFFIAVAI